MCAHKRANMCVWTCVQTLVCGLCGGSAFLFVVSLRDGAYVRECACVRVRACVWERKGRGSGCMCVDVWMNVCLHILLHMHVGGHKK